MMEELVNLIVNNGVGVACLIYFMWYNHNDIEKNNTILTDLKLSILELKNEISKLSMKE